MLYFRCYDDDKKLVYFVSFGSNEFIKENKSHKDWHCKKATLQVRIQNNLLKDGNKKK